MKTVLLFVLFFVGGCARTPVQTRGQAMRLASPPELSDDLGVESLRAAWKEQVTHWKSLPPNGKVTFGSRVLTREQHVLGLETLVKFSEAAKNWEELFQAVRQSFDFYEVYGGDSWGDVFLTSYYEPEIVASLKKTEKLSAPVLKAPPDLVEVALSQFDTRFADLGPMRGRLMPSKEDPKRSVLVPYFKRDEIDDGKVLSRKKLEIAWADPVDIFIMQIQGSGTLFFPDGTRKAVSFAEQNGHRYESVGKFLLDKIPRETMTLQTIEAYLRSLPSAEMRQILFKNPSYVFFKERDGAAKTYFGTPVSPGRTIATDPRFLPAGAAAFLSFEKPRFAGKGDLEPTDWTPTSRFVVGDDTGGAIRGAGRADLFWGTGDEAKRYAGVMKRSSRLYYLVPKEEFLQK